MSWNTWNTEQVTMIKVTSYKIGKICNFWILELLVDCNCVPISWLQVNFIYFTLQNLLRLRKAKCELDGVFLSHGQNPSDIHFIISRTNAVKRHSKLSVASLIEDDD